MRKDALERRRALLRAASDVFAEQGLDAPLEIIADRAGVGRATLYRNFSDRIVLALAVLTQAVQDLADQVRGWGDDPNAFFRFLDELAALTAHNAGFASAVRARAPADALAPLRRAIIDAGEDSLRRAQQAGLVRADLGPSDISLIVALMSAAAGLQACEADRTAASRRAIAFIVDGLKPRA